MRQTYDVLVTDGDEDVRMLMAEVLAFEGYRVLALPKDRFTIDVVKEVNPLLIIVDLHPYTADHTCSLINQLAQHQKTCEVGLLLTATEERLLNQTTGPLDSECCLPLLKPFELTHFLTQVRQLIRQQMSPQHT